MHSRYIIRYTAKSIELYLWRFQGLQVVVQVEIAPAALGAIYNKKQI